MPRSRSTSPRAIRSLNGLVKELLRQRDPASYAAILERAAIPLRELEPFFRWNSRHYTRTCVHGNDAFELMVICYEPGQRTSVHDYDSQTAWIHAVMGTVVEERFELLPDGSLRCDAELHLYPGRVDRLTNGSAIHRFTNPGPERAVTLNLYARPLRKWRVYDERTGLSRMAPVGPPR